MFLQPLGSLALILALSAPQALELREDPVLHVDRDERRRTLTLTYGPLDLPAHGNYGGEFVAITAEVEVPVEGWFRSFEIALVDEFGERVNAPLLHHAGLFAPGRKDLFSPAMERVVAFGQETAPIRLPGQLGYPVVAGDTLLILGALYNTGSVAWEGLHLRVGIVYADARRDVRHTDVLPLYLDVMPPGNRVYEIPPGRSSRSMEWSPAVDGRILALGGHLHQYGESLVLENVTSGETIWIGTATHDENDELIEVTRDIYLRGRPMRSEHVYRITATYDNPTGAPVHGAMGKIGGVFQPDRGQVLQSVDRSDAAYLRDWHAMVHHEHEHAHVQAAEQVTYGH